jgi:hypothetical protein
MLQHPLLERQCLRSGGRLLLLLLLLLLALLRGCRCMVPPV